MNMLGDLGREANARLRFKIFKRRRIIKRRHHKSSNPLHSFRYGSHIRRTYSLLIKEFDKNGYIQQKYVRKIIDIPKIFSFKSNFDDSILVYKMLLSSYILGVGHVILNFTSCKKADIANFELLNVLVDALVELKERYNYGLHYPTHKFIKCVCSKYDGKTNKYLHAFKYHQLEEEFCDDSKFLPLNLFKGRNRRSYKENMKAIAVSQIVDFVRESVRAMDVDLSVNGQNSLEGFTSEVLNNAEDHSLAKSEWFVNGIAFNEVQEDVNVIELNLSIMNVGLSMYGGFEETKEQNISIYNKLDDLYEEHVQKFPSNKVFSRESMFMLYMLNEGISRLKYLDDSRGHGTMNFIEAFIELGSFGEINNKFQPRLNIISGHSVLTCDNKYKPYKDGTFRKISLNKDRSIRSLPDKDYLQYNQEYFPGTILECKIYLNKEHTQNILKANGTAETYN